MVKGTDAALTKCKTDPTVVLEGEVAGKCPDKMNDDDSKCKTSQTYSIKCLKVAEKEKVDTGATSSIIEMEGQDSCRDKFVSVNETACFLEAERHLPIIGK